MTTWPLRLDLDVERHFPREWWAEGADDALPDGLSGVEAAQELVRAAVVPHRAIALLSDRGDPALRLSHDTGVGSADDFGGGASTPEAVAQGEPLPTAPPGLLTISEAAERLGVGRCMVQQLVLDGSIRSFKIGRKLRRIPPEAIDEYIRRSLGDDV